MKCICQHVMSHKHIFKSLFRLVLFWSTEKIFKEQMSRCRTIMYCILVRRRYKSHKRLEINSLMARLTQHLAEVSVNRYVWKENTSPPNRVGWLGEICTMLKLAPYVYHTVCLLSSSESQCVYFSFSIFKYIQTKLGIFL